MARPLRIEFEGAVYHVTSRGNERKDIFFDKEDREKFFEYLELTKTRYKVVIYGYCLMDNHYHLLVETTQPNLTRFMRDLNGHYTIYFNRRHKRFGHLFQGRYKAILVDKETYLLELSRYIHLNPVRAKITAKPESYAYSTMKYYLAPATAPAWIDMDFILSQFGRKQAKQTSAYKQYVYDGVGKTVSPLSNLHADCILGTEEFIRKIGNKILKNRDISSQTPRLKKLKHNIDTNDTMKLVLAYYRVDKAVLLKKKARSNSPKKAFVYLSRKYTDCGLVGMKQLLDNTVSEAGISKLFNRTDRELQKDKLLRSDMEKLEEKLLA